MSKAKTIVGRLVPFKDGRMVFLAKQPKAVYVGFKSNAGEDTKIVLSHEAFDALIAMANDPVVGTPERDFPIAEPKPAWRWGGR